MRVPAHFSTTIVTTENNCRQGVNCHLPDCFCSTLEHPLNRKEIPQMVFFGFDDAVNPESVQHYDFLFGRNRYNPNGCPISATLYISHQNTKYDIVKKYYDRGFEVAVHSVSHTNIDTYTKVMEEARDQRNNIATLAGVPIEEIVGWRSPNLFTAGDAQVTALQNLGYTYDISLSHRKLNMDDRDMWPFTLDYGCQGLSKCPKQKHKGFWQIPVNMVVWKKEQVCVYVDGCYKQPNNTDEAYNFIMDNFKRYYDGNRAPFGINMHMAWFYRPYTREGMDRAIQDMLKYNDVYIVTAKQMLQWMKNPTNLSQIMHFKDWDCNEENRRKREKGRKSKYFFWGEVVIVAVILSCLAVVVVYWVISKQGKQYTSLQPIATADEYTDGDI
ncbi:chitin deacetylase 7-like [Ylistrum balloti]|uniref:chitin deacetylase 7-like n=1 Tax=Ylistrum balloti TaxID=509963 RepID=UPI002905A399|nr:chitin deacetylase 7-like [Ylistrum balloti]